MRFEARELKPYAEPVQASKLKEGEVYFAVNFLDEEMLVPVLEPLVFIGTNLDGDTPGLVHFQDADSYRRGVSYQGEDVDGDATFYQGAEPNHIFEYERALDVLLKCALRRKK